MFTIVKLVKGIIEFLTTVTGFIAALGVVAAAIVITEAVIIRKLFNMSTIWQTEAAVFMLIFATFVGSAFVQKNEHHLNVDFLLVYLPAKVREILLVIVSIATLAISVFFAYHAWPMWWEAFTKDQHTMSLWGPPLWIPYFFLPFGMTLLSLQYLIYISKKISKLLRGDFDADMVRAELKDVDIKKTANDTNE